MNIKIAKAYRTTSGEALCILNGITPIDTKAVETATLYRATRDRHNHQLEHEVDPKNWTHPADVIRISDQGEQKNIQYTYLLLEARANMESARVLLYTYKTN
jgi:hypothetical protein